MTIFPKPNRTPVSGKPIACPPTKFCDHIHRTRFGIFRQYISLALRIRISLFVSIHNNMPLGISEEIVNTITSNFTYTLLRRAASVALLMELLPHSSPLPLPLPLLPHPSPSPSPLLLNALLSVHVQSRPLQYPGSWPSIQLPLLTMTYNYSCCFYVECTVYSHTYIYMYNFWRSE